MALSSSFLRRPCAPNGSRLSPQRLSRPPTRLRAVAPLAKVFKSDLVDRVAAATQLKKDDATVAVNVILDTIVDAVSKGEEVALIGFGTFKPRELKEREGRNPQTGQPMHIAASKTVGFVPGKTFKDHVKHGGTPPLAAASKK